MAENRHDEEIHLPEIDRPEAHHEERDVNVWAVGKFAIALVFVCIIVLAVLVGVFHYFATREGGALPQTELNVDARKLPPSPRLQSAPILDLEQMRAAENKLLNSYGWIDQSKGVVRIPIDRAMDLLAQRGLPSRPQTGVQSASTAIVPTESGLGPVMQPPGGPLAPQLGKQGNQ